MCSTQALLAIWVRIPIGGNLFVAKDKLMSCVLINTHSFCFRAVFFSLFSSLPVSHPNLFFFSSLVSQSFFNHSLLNHVDNIELCVNVL